MLNLWMLSQFSTDESGNRYPVCSAYANGYFCPALPATDTDFALVQCVSHVHQVDAARSDPRIVVCGMMYDPPPAQALTAYQSQLDPAVTYSMLGQVISRLAAVADPNFQHVMSAN